MKTNMATVRKPGRCRSSGTPNTLALPPQFGGPRTIIYILIDPRTDEIRYVGKTNRSIKARISAHLQDTCKCHRTHWLAELKAAGMRPVGVELESIEGLWPWQVEERYWISKLRSMGARLTNNTSGGDGVPDLPPETRERMRGTWLGRKHTPESIERIRAASGSRTHSAETKSRMSRAQKGRKIHWIGKIAAVLRKFTPEMAVVVKQRLDAGEGVVALSKELGIHRTTVSRVKAGTYFLPHRRPASPTPETQTNTPAA